MRRSWTRASRTELVLLAALAAWGLFPLVLLLAHTINAHARFTGADGLIGADGVLGADQLQYLAWARDAGAHGLASDLFSLAPSGHVYLQPLFAISGELWRLGLSLQLAYLLWKPVAVIALFAGTLAWARRMFGDQARARAAVVVLSLFLYTPLAALTSWATLGSGRFQFQMYLLGYELLAANKLWGYAPSALALALMPVTLLATERALAPSLTVAGAPEQARPGDTHAADEARPDGTHAPEGARPDGTRGPLALACLAALLASWLHPWQGVTLLVIFAGLIAWQRLRGWLTLAAPALAAALPLVYYHLLSSRDPAWRLASHYEVVARLPPLVLLAGLGPLALIAAVGVRRPGGVMIERALLLWIAGCFVTYFTVDSFAPHALQGLSLPFAVLAVRGWRRMRLPAALGAVAIALATLPGLAYDGRKFVNVAGGSAPQYYLTGSDAQALDWVTHQGPPGGVLAPTPFAAVVPSQTGRAVWVGNGYWSRDYFARAHTADALFGGRLRPARARAFVLATGAALLVSDCRHPTDLTRPLRDVLQRAARITSAAPASTSSSAPGRPGARGKTPVTGALKVQTSDRGSRLGPGRSP